MDIKNLFDLHGRKALVTGAGRGIGKVLALALVEAGCSVAIVEINIGDAEKTTAEITEAGGKAFAFKADMTVKTDVDNAFAAAAQALGGLDICVNNAGVCIHEAAEDTPVEHLDYVIDTNLKGVFYGCQAAAAVMLPAGKGSIVNIASMSGTVANYPQKQAHYNASKAGVILLSKCLAVEWAPRGVRVNTVSPGYTRTEMTMMAADLVPRWEELTPMGRMGKPEDLVGAVIYLASDASGFTTGSDIIVDGGYTAR